MSRFNESVVSEKVENLAGGKAFKMNAKQELVHAVLTSFLEDKFYESGNARINRIVNLIQQCPDEFVAKLAAVARKEFHLRSVFHVLVAELSKKHKGDDLVKKVIQYSERPDDLTEIAAYLDGKLPKQVKRGFRHALLKFSPYQLAKYRAQDKKVKMVDLFNLVHPNPTFASVEQVEAWNKLMNGELKNTETWESRLSSGEDKEQVWADMVLESKIGYMALLRNLRNIEEQGNLPTKLFAATLISDEQAVKKSKQLPFRFWNAYKNVKDRIFNDAIAKAMDISVNNVPSLDGKTLVAIDVSGSMSGQTIEKAAVLGAALIKKNDADVILYDTAVRAIKFNSLDSVVSNTEKIIKNATGGGTQTSLVFEYAMNSGVAYDRIIILSDNESWSESYYGSSVQHVYEKYRKTNDCFVYAVDIQGYGTKDIKSNKVEHICGFSERIFDFMAANERGLDTLENYIDSFEL